MPDWAWATIARADGSRWAITERDASGEMIGTAYRDADGGKTFAPGGKRGLIVPWPLAAYAGSSAAEPVFVCEGASDTAAVLGPSLDALGVPMTTGRAWPDGSPCARGSVALVAGEDDPHDTIRPRLDAHGADATRVHLLQSVVRIGRNGAASEAAFTLANLRALETALGQVAGCALVIVDPIGSFIGGGVDAHRDNEVRGVQAPLATLAHRSGAAVLLVAHRRKGAASHADDLVLGSRALTGIARSVLHLLTDPDKDGRRLLLPGKTNLARPAAGLAFTIGGIPPRVEWEPDPVAMTADGVLAAQAGTDDEGRTERDDAAAWLRDYLGDGPKLARGVLTESKAAGFSKRTIDRAKSVAGVRTRKEAFGGGWVWELGAPSQERQPDAENRHTPDGGKLGATPDESRENRPKIATPEGLATLRASSGNPGGTNVGAPIAPAA